MRLAASVQHAASNLRLSDARHVHLVSGSLCTRKMISARDCSFAWDGSISSISWRMSTACRSVPGRSRRRECCVRRRPEQYPRCKDTIECKKGIRNLVAKHFLADIPAYVRVWCTELVLLHRLIFFVASRQRMKSLGTGTLRIRQAFSSVVFLFASSISAAGATLFVDASGIQSGFGNVFAGLCVGGLEEESCRFGQTSPAHSDTMRFTFADVPAGTYAVAVFQDLNGNGRLDRTPLGLPLEPYGFSRDAGRLRRPSFSSASIEIRDQNLRIGVRLTSIPQDRLP